MPTVSSLLRYLKMKIASFISVATLILASSAQAAPSSDIKDNKSKLADDPTKVVTKVGVSYANNYDFDDTNVSLSGSLAFDPVRKINFRLNDDASEWRIGGSWLFPVGILNFNFGKNEYTNGATQTNYSVGTFIPLSVFGVEPLGIQLFPMAGYTYNDGESPRCDGVGECAEPGFVGTPSAETGFTMVESAGSSGYVGAFGLKPITKTVTMMGFAAGTYGSANDEGENYKGFFMGAGISYLANKKNSFSLMTFLMDNNTYLDEPDERVIASYTYQFN